jgi:hypothetical protein
MLHAAGRAECDTSRAILANPFKSGFLRTIADQRVFFVPAINDCASVVSGVVPMQVEFSGMTAWKVGRYLPVAAARSPP